MWSLRSQTSSSGPHFHPVSQCSCLVLSPFQRSHLSELITDTAHNTRCVSLSWLSFQYAPNRPQNYFPRISFYHVIHRNTFTPYFLPSTFNVTPPEFSSSHWKNRSVLCACNMPSSGRGFWWVHTHYRLQREIRKQPEAKVNNFTTQHLHFQCCWSQHAPRLNVPHVGFKPKSWGLG